MLWSFLSLIKTWSPFPSLKAHWVSLISVSLALSQTPVFTQRDHGCGWSRYQIILLGDRGTCVWTTCLKSLPGSVPVRSRTCASELPQDYKSDTLPLDYRDTTLSLILPIKVRNVGYCCLRNILVLLFLLKQIVNSNAVAVVFDNSNLSLRKFTFQNKKKYLNLPN